MIRPPSHPLLVGALFLVAGCGVPNPIPGPLDIIGTTIETVGNVTGDVLEAGCEAGRICTPDCPDGQEYDRDAGGCVFED